MEEFSGGDGAGTVHINFPEFLHYLHNVYRSQIRDHDQVVELDELLLGQPQVRRVQSPFCERGVDAAHRFFVGVVGVLWLAHGAAIVFRAALRSGPPW